MASRRYPQFDFSGGLQTATTWQLKKPNEVVRSVNYRFDKVIGAAVRRDGYEQFATTIETGNRAYGAHVSRFSDGAEIFVAINNTADNATVVRYHDSGDDSWDDLITGLAVNTKVNITDFIDYAFVSGVSSADTYMTPRTIANDRTVSTSLHLQNAPKAKFFAEYNGYMHAINVELDSVKYKNRVYRSSPPLGVVTYTRGAQVLTATSGDLEIAVDSVRYIKTGMAFDLYQAGTSSKLYDLTVTAVDKAANTFSVAIPASQTVSAIDTGTEVFTVTSTTDFPTGTPVQIAQGTPASPLVVGTTYYVINASATTLKLATTAANATAGTAINMTDTGTGTMTIYKGLTFSDNDEIWGDGRFGKLTLYWNTDYPTADKADWFEIPPGVSTDNNITAWAKSNNRLFLFTSTSTVKYDGQNIPTVYETIGCVSHETIEEIAGWLIWQDASGNIWARNDASGQEELISRAVESSFLFELPTTNIENASAGKVGNLYKICIGTVNGSVRRLVYDFNANNWTEEKHTRNILYQLNHDESGVVKPYFLDDTGKMFMDETGNTDDGTPITTELELGRDNQTNEWKKRYQGCYVYGTNLAGATVKLALEGGEHVDRGQITGNVTKIAFPNTTEGRDCNYLITNTNTGDAEQIEGIATYLTEEQDGFE
jgi:hypothetical protein